MLRAYVWKIEPPAWYFMDFGIWETIAHNSMLLVMTWLGDGLVVRAMVLSLPLKNTDIRFLDLPLLGGLEL